MQSYLLNRLPLELLETILNKLPESDFRSVCDAYRENRNFITALCQLRLRMIARTAPRILSNPPLNAMAALERACFRMSFRRTLIFAVGLLHYDRSSIIGPPTFFDNIWFPEGLPVDFYLEWTEHRYHNVDSIATLISEHKVCFECNCPICHAYLGLVSQRYNTRPSDNKLPVVRVSPTAKLAYPIYHTQPKIIHPTEYLKLEHNFGKGTYEILDRHSSVFNELLANNTKVTSYGSDFLSF
jgi:hypothetical protein